MNEERTYSNTEIQEIKRIYQEYLKLRRGYENLPFRVIEPSAPNVIRQMKQYPAVFEAEIEWAGGKFEE